jgi:hypothetical protein
MHSYHSFLTIIVASFIGCLQPCRAQTTGEISLSFVSFPKSPEPVKLKLWLGEGKLLDIEAPSKWLSSSVRIPPLAAWVVGEMVQGPDGKPIFKEYGRATASSASEQILLLIRKGSENAAGFNMVALDSRASEFGAGKYLFMNATEVEVAGRIAKEKFVIKPGNFAIMKPKVSEGEPTFHAALYCREGQEVRPFFSSEWRVNAGARNLVFCYTDPTTSRIRIHVINDFIPQ